MKIQNETIMKLIWTAAIAVALLKVASACATAPQQRSGSCDITSLGEIIKSPLKSSGKRFCGEAFILKRARSIYIVDGIGEQPSDDLSLLITTATSRFLGKLRLKPKRYYIEGRVEPMEECFAPPNDNGEECSPYRRPVFFHLEMARRY